MVEAVKRSEGGGGSDRMVGEEGEDDGCKSWLEPVRIGLAPRRMKRGKLENN